LEEALDLSFDRLLMMMMTLQNVAYQHTARATYCQNIKKMSFTLTQAPFIWLLKFECSVHSLMEFFDSVLCVCIVLNNRTDVQSFVPLQSQSFCNVEIWINCVILVLCCLEISYLYWKPNIYS